MASKFMYSNRDHKFIIKEWLDGKKIIGLKRFQSYLNIEDVDGILDQSLKMSREIVAHTNDDGDTIGATFKDGKVTVPPSFHKAFKFIQENSWGSSNSDVDGEGALPEILNEAVREYIIAANPSISPYIGLCGGIASVIKAFGSPEQIALYTPKRVTVDLMKVRGVIQVSEQAVVTAENIEESATEVSATMQIVATAAQSLAQKANQLQKEVKRFKV